MRNAAFILGLIGGFWALVVGFFSYGYIQAVTHFEGLADIAPQVDNPDVIRAIAVIAPMMAIAGAAMARARALWGGVLLLLATGGMYYAYGIGVFTIFSLAFCALAGILAIAAGKPDQEKAHF